MKISLSKIESNILACLSNFSIEALLGLCFFIMFCVAESNQVAEYENVRILWNVMALFPLFFVITYTCNVTCHAKWRFMYYLSLVYFVPTLFFDLKEFVFSIYYFFTMLLTVFLLLASGGNRDNTTFAKDSIQTIINLIISLLIGHVLQLAICAIIGSVIYIFNIEWFDWLEYSYFSCLFIFIPLLFCFMQLKERFSTMPPFMEIIISFILSPAIIIYTGILYLYFITITINWELPKGGIGYMVLAFVIISLGGKMAQLVVRKQYFNWFYTHFSVIAIPPLIIFWIGTIERIATYSFTASRVYLLAAGILMTLYIFLLFSKRFGSYQLMLVISTFCIALLTYIPGFNAKSIGIYAQEKRLNQYIQKLDMLDPSTHKLKQKYIVSNSQSQQWKDMQELEECYRYLSKEMGYKHIEECYGTLYNSAPAENEREYIFMDGNIDITGFTQYYGPDMFALELKENGIITIQQKANKNEIICYNIDSLMNAKPQIFKSKASKKQLLSFKNDSCMLLLQSISFAKIENRVHCYEASIASVLMK